MAATNSTTSKYIERCGRFTNFLIYNRHVSKRKFHRKPLSVYTNIEEANCIFTAPRINRNCPTLPWSPKLFSSNSYFSSKGFHFNCGTVRVCFFSFYPSLLFSFPTVNRYRFVNDKNKTYFAIFIKKETQMSTRKKTVRSEARKLLKKYQNIYGSLPRELWGSSYCSGLARVRNWKASAFQSVSLFSSSYLSLTAIVFRPLFFGPGQRLPSTLINCLLVLFCCILPRLSLKFVFEHRVPGCTPGAFWRIKLYSKLVCSETRSSKQAH